MQTVPLPTPIYHFTHIDNFENLLQSGALLSKKLMNNRHINYTNSAYDSIQGQRSVFPVPVEPGGTIHDYVPFYFTSLTPMLYTIKCGNLEDRCMKDMVFCQSTAQMVKRNGKKYVFTDGHGIMALTDFYNNLDHLDEVEWEVIKAKYWTNYPEGRRLRQAEFLVYGLFEWQLVETIGVYDQSMKDRVINQLAKTEHRPAVNINRNWYF